MAPMISESPNIQRETRKDDRLMRLSELPDWLTAALQPERISDAMQQNIPEFVSGELVLINCQAKRLFLKKTDGKWTGSYQVTFKRTYSEDEEKVQLRGILTSPEITIPVGVLQPTGSFGKEGWRCYLPELYLNLEMEPPDEDLPAVPMLINPEKSRVLLEQNFQNKGFPYEDLRIRSCTPEIIMNKPGTRCIIRYSLEFDSSADGMDKRINISSWPGKIFAKTYRKAQNADNAYYGMLELWHTPLSEGNVVTISEPLFLIPEHKLMVQKSIPGNLSLEDLLKTTLSIASTEMVAEAHEALRKTAVGLAAIHQSGLNYGETVTWEKSIDKVHRLTDRLVVPFPEFKEVLTPIQSKLEAFANAHPADPLVPTHGAFHPEQVLLNGNKIGFIDFDDFCMAEPAMDVGLFRAALNDTGLSTLGPSADREAFQNRMAHLDTFGEVFLSQYEAVAPVSRVRVALWEAIEYLLGSLYHWIKVKPAESDYELFLLERQIQKMELGL